MSKSLPSNDEVEAFGEAIDWQLIEEQKQKFNAKLQELAAQSTTDDLMIAELAAASGAKITLMYEDSDHGNVLLGHIGDHAYVLGSFVSTRYRHGKTALQSVVPYNFNPSVHHHNLTTTHNPDPELRALGAELELGLYHSDGSMPTEEEVQQFASVYRNYAQTLGITPEVDREACIYQVEVHVAPGTGYHRTRISLEGIMKSLVAASEATNLYTAIMSAYPVASDFVLTDHPKVHTAVEVMLEVNSFFPEHLERMNIARKRYHISSDANVVQIFRLQGCHIHLDIAGRSEALGLFTFYTMLRSATAIANAAILKGGPFVNGTCDEELLCVREYLRSTTVTGQFLEIPMSPHLIPDGLERYSDLLHSERANAPARALLHHHVNDTHVSVMHNPIGRIRPDLGISKRICTIESTGMPVNISASRQAAVLTDFEFTHVLVENYYRQYGMDLTPMRENDETLWDIIGPYSPEQYQSLQDYSDREGSDIILELHSGKKVTLPEFYEMKRTYMHKVLIDFPSIKPRDIDEVYMSINRMLAPPSGRIAQTPEEYIADPTRRSTGNWGRILRNAYLEEGGTPGTYDPERVLRVTNRVHEALIKRYS